jgi:hypothetical protein
MDIRYPVDSCIYPISTLCWLYKVLFSMKVDNLWNKENTGQ